MRRRTHSSVAVTWSSAAGRDGLTRVVVHRGSRTVPSLGAANVLAHPGILVARLAQGAWGGSPAPRCAGTGLRRRPRNSVMKEKAPAKKNPTPT